jgi:hypothetical protein
MQDQDKMQDKETIDHEIAAARGDLEHELGELKDIVRDKLDVKKRVREGVQHGKQELRDLARRARSGAREHPGTVVGLLAGLALLVGAVVFARRRLRMDGVPGRGAQALSPEALLLQRCAELVLRQ